MQPNWCKEAILYLAIPAVPWVANYSIYALGFAAHAFFTSQYIAKVPRLEKQNDWLKYWVVFSLFHLLTSSVEWALGPRCGHFYYCGKIMLVMHIGTNWKASNTIYNMVLPLLRQTEGAITVVGHLHDNFIRLLVGMFPRHPIFVGCIAIVVGCIGALPLVTSYAVAALGFIFPAYASHCAIERDSLSPSLLQYWVVFALFVLVRSPIEWVLPRNDCPRLVRYYLWPLVQLLFVYVHCSGLTSRGYHQNHNYPLYDMVAGNRTLWRVTLMVYGFGLVYCVIVEYVILSIFRKVLPENSLSFS
eukprot:TRINITY_DN9727_c2_g1_i2.p1 TRINITY_DN9727_c2_g1~~TRINITY_DN9727_c2_g1_i2.p1  ORF type:complete len:325 (+),score=29.28 TRINITY_DN9727_c2_g1_i2:70-975(+)